jgi:hypothetical protein
MQRSARLLPADTLRTSATITDVQRPAAGSTGPVLITYTQPGAAQRTLSCGALVNTVAQGLPNLGFLRLDDVETALFRSVYWCRCVCCERRLQENCDASLAQLKMRLLPRSATSRRR